jgi:PAS domain S-box-containing protein
VFALAWQQRQLAHRQAVADLDDLRLRYAAIVESTEDAVISTDLDGVVNGWNPGAEQLFGYTAPAALGQSIALLLPAEQREEETRILAQIARGESVSHYETWRRHQDGHLMAVSVSIAPIRDARGAIVGAAKITRDNTERHAALEAIRESEEKFRIFTQYSGDAFIMINGDDGRILLWNRAAETLFGYPAELALGQELHQLIAPERFRGPAAVGLAHFARTGSGAAVGKTLELTGVRRNGEEFPLELSLAGIPREGRWLAAGVIRDISERKRIEAELARANQAKGEFLANMSHEIRTPLNAILGLTQILERDTLAPDQQDLLHKISEAGSGLLHIINDILDFSKIEAGQFQIDPAPFGLDALLIRLENLLTATAQRKGLTLAVRSPDDFPGQLVGDSLRIEQVLTNLIGNAIKFTAQGRVEVSVTPLAVTEQTVRLRFTVTDTGVGITPEQREKLFQPFSQADASTTRRFGGTGLGLSISKRLVELMGGTIGVTSTPGQGSTFWFELPLCPAAVATACQQPTPPITVQGPRLTGLRVLAVDDVRINLFMLQRALQLEGATVSLAADGLQALDTLRASPAAFDVVLMDIQMPVMDGLTATRTLREDPTFAELPIIALTAGVMAEERAAAQTAGMSGFLAKPLDLGQMVAVLLPYVPVPAAT